MGNQYLAFEFGIALLSCMASLHAFKIYQLCFVFLSLWTSNWLILCIHLWPFLSTLYDRCCQEWALYWKSEPCFVYPGEFITVACFDSVSICPLNSVLYPPHDSQPCLPCNSYQLFTGSLVLREKARMIWRTTVYLSPYECCSNYTGRLVPGTWHSHIHLRPLCWSLLRWQVFWYSLPFLPC